MKLSRNARATRSRSSTTAVGLLLLMLFFALTLASSAGAAATAVPLGSATSFAVLAGAGTTDTGPTTINGDIGTFPTTSMTVTGSETVNGTNHAGDAVTQQAQTDLTTAYNSAAGQGPITPIVADLGGQTLAAGVYESASSIGLTGTVTLDAAGDPNAVFVFKADSSTLTTASGSNVSLINGAQSCNVYWQIGSSATLGTGSTFRGTVLALTSITVTHGVTVDGRVLARNGAVTLDNDTITAPGCAPPAANPSREIYCDPSGKSYDLIIGQNTQPPYNTLGLVPAYVDPVTGSKSCNFPAAVVTPPTTPPTPTAPTPAKPTPKKPTPTALRKPPAAAKPATVKAASSPSAAKSAFGLTG
jgi:hypothetical protein